MSESVLSVENIHKTFGELEVLKGISLTANKGDVVSILGSSGSGKSTFLRCVNFLEQPDQGKVVVDGKEVVFDSRTQKKITKETQAKISLIRTQLGMVFQGFNLWSHMTVLDNVMEGPVHVLKRPKAEVKDEAMEYLKKVGLAEKASSYPSQLSGGQQQRVAIARALAMQPKVLLFDEPTSALDPELVNEVLLVIQSLANEGRTMLIVTHEMSFARNVSSNVVFLHQGKIEEQGNPQDFFERPQSNRLREFIAHEK